MIKRLLQKAIKERLFKGKALLLFGARQTGKSTLAEAILEKQDKPWMLMNGDDADVRAILSSTSANSLKALIGKNEILLIDEAQRIENIGLTIKNHHRPDKKCTGNCHRLFFI
ncbi:MAG: AAA family ATPase [Ferruginibacter sp.]